MQEFETIKQYIQLMRAPQRKQLCIQKGDFEDDILLPNRISVLNLLITSAVVF